MEIIAKIDIPVVFKKMGEGKLLTLFDFLPPKSIINVKRRHNLFCENKKRTLRFFHRRGTNCPVCGIEGKYFAFYRENKGCKINFSPFAEKDGVPVLMTIDHIIPMKWGGKKHTDTNLCPMCFSCNNKKGDTFDFCYAEPIKTKNKVEVIENYDEFYYPVL